MRFRDLMDAVFGRPRPATTRKPSRFVPRLEGFEDRTVPATFSVAAGGSIQAAINSAAAANDGNDVINIAKATYTGNLVIPNSANLTNLVIQTSGTRTAENDLAVVKAASGAVITVDGEAGVTIKRLKIDGSSTQANQGVYVINGGSATIQSNFIRNFNPSSGEGIGVRVGRFQGGPVAGGTVTVTGNTITGYRDAGVVITNSSVGTVTCNTVTGRGSGIGITQNGIEFSFGATGTATSNIVTANGFKNGPAATAASAGILLYQAGAGVQVGAPGAGNTVSNNNFGIAILDGISPIIRNNTVSGSTWYGIGFDSSDGVALTYGATVENNSSSNSTAGTEADGFAFTYLRSTAANPVNITKNNANSNTGDGFFFNNFVVMDPGSSTVAENGNANSNKLSGYHVKNSSGLSINGLNGSNNGNANGNTLHGIFIEGSSNITVGNYNTNSNLGNGVYVTGSTGVTVTSGIARLNTLNGYLFENSSGLTVTNNQAGHTTGTKQSDGGNGRNGFSFVDTDDSTVTGNLARLNNRNGILLDANSTGNTLSGNTLNTNNKGSNGSFDANDQSGDATTPGNTWAGNNEGTKNRTWIN